MFSNNTEAIIDGDLAQVQSNVASSDPLIEYLEDGGDIRAELGLESIFTVPELIAELKTINTAHNGDNVYSPTVDYLTITFIVVHSEDTTKVAYLTISRDLTAQDITDMETALHVVMSKLTDNVYRLESES